MNFPIASSNHFYKRQLLHLIGYILLITISFQLVNRLELGNEFSISAGVGVGFLFALLMAPIHQFYVWYVWRKELCFKSISPLFGNNGFKAYSRGFAILALLRITSVLILGIVDYHSLAMNNVLFWIIVPILIVLVGYTFYSIRKYFGFERAFGADHFFPEYRDMPFVREGIFKYSSNSMYAFGILLLPLIGLLLKSELALLAGIYHYITGWLHYYCTEKPDIEVIYGEKENFRI